MRKNKKENELLMKIVVKRKLSFAKKKNPQKKNPESSNRNKREVNIF